MGGGISDIFSLLLKSHYDQPINRQFLFLTTFNNKCYFPGTKIILFLIFVCLERCTFISRDVNTSIILCKVEIPCPWLSTPVSTENAIKLAPISLRCKRQILMVNIQGPYVCIWQHWLSLPATCVAGWVGYVNIMSWQEVAADSCQVK